MSNCKYETKNGRCSLKDSYAYRHKCYTEESCKCHEAIEPCGRREPMTNADRIRAMSDEELAKFIANKIVNLENHKMIEQGHTPTATQLSALGHTCYCTLVQWLKQPAEGDA